MLKLPTRIAALMVATIVVFVVTIWAATSWLGYALDAQARDQSVAQVRTARDNLLSQARLTLLDYAKWEAAVEAVDAKDYNWVRENVGWAATTGQVVQLVVIWGGAYEEDLGWQDDGIEEGRPGLLEPATFDLAESSIASKPIGTYDAKQFFAWQGDSVFAMSTSRLEVINDSGEEGATMEPDSAIERLLMGRRLSDEAIQSIADSFMLTGLGVVREAPADRPSVPLVGGDGTPVAYLAWDMPHPGTTMLQQMTPALAVIVILMAGLAVLGTALVRRNARDLVHAEMRASVAARTDEMTQLPNRVAFNGVLAAPAKAGERAILFLDVNDFKRVNDSIGHAAGDQVIRAIAQRLSKFASSTCFFARLAGDEFVFVVQGPGAQGRTELLADAVRGEVSNPFSIMGHQLQLSLAIGYAVQDEDEMSGDELVRQADLAMYEAKRRAGGSPVAFSAFLEHASSEALAIEHGLRAALTSPGEISVVYQPIVRADGRLERAEALARWTSPELGVVSPDRFIQVAERAGLIIELGRRLLQIICDDLQANPELQVSINVSPLQLISPDFVQTLVRDLKNRRIDPGRIEIELTESMIVEDTRLAAERLAELHAAGFSTALDDFGTGYSSMGYLAQMRFDTLKIDRSYVSKVNASTNGASVMDGLISIAHGLQLRVVCEGVETGEQLGLLHGMGAELVQGYHLDKPLPVAALVERWLRHSDTRAAVA